ncbi:Gpi1-domain-containing protein [Athelia psychrophila]|uniref:Gpi1-domain-containing protein n=1 Tax=Athelia psychrophila TaxID=1759441 RepID=A0A166SZ34_9AGAM|nr:Gpi1-domain-containing protein [Fibularhizoctonia sp. CBS 109695]
MSSFFYNAVWLISNDVIVGTAFGVFLCENNHGLAALLRRTVENIVITWLQHALIWLDSWPAGLKLNTELSRFYSVTFIYLLGLWGYVLNQVLSYLPAILYAIGVSSCAGMSMGISLFSDLLFLFTAHIHACYLISATVYHHQLQTLASLWNLFRGRRYNLLRNRVDTWDYDIDQLLFGTILFTLVSFLFPTVLAYYALFAMMRLGTVLLYASLETLLAFVNHFPLFALVLRLKDPQRLPGGIYLSSSSTSSWSSLHVKNQPIPLALIFGAYGRMGTLLWYHYNPIRLLSSIISGRYLAAIPHAIIELAE